MTVSDAAPQPVDARFAAPAFLTVKKPAGIAMSFSAFSETSVCRTGREKNWSSSPGRSRPALMTRDPCHNLCNTRGEPQRSGFAAKRRCDAMSELLRLRGSEGYEVHTDAEA